MVENNNAEERLIRIERMLEALQRESATSKTMTAKIIAVVSEAQTANQKPAPRRSEPPR